MSGCILGTGAAVNSQIHMTTLGEVSPNTQHVSSRDWLQTWLAGAVGVVVARASASLLSSHGRVPGTSPG